MLAAWEEVPVPYYVTLIRAGVLMVTLSALFFRADCAFITAQAPEGIRKAYDDAREIVENFARDTAEKEADNAQEATSLLNRGADAAYLLGPSDSFRLVGTRESASTSLVTTAQASSPLSKPPHRAPLSVFDGFGVRLVAEMGSFGCGAVTLEDADGLDRPDCGSSGPGEHPASVLSGHIHTHGSVARPFPN